MNFERCMRAFGAKDVRVEERTGTITATVDGLAYRWPGSYLRRLAYGGDVDLTAEEFCTDEFVVRARRGVL